MRCKQTNILFLSAKLVACGGVVSPVGIQSGHSPKIVKKVLQDLHQDHPGVKKLNQQNGVTCGGQFWTRKSKLSVVLLARQVMKQAPPVAALHPWVWPSQPWQWVHYNFPGPFQGAMFLHAVDPFWKWPEVHVIVISPTNVPATLDVWREWQCTHCIPERIMMDNGSHFTAEAFKAFSQCNEIWCVRRAPYHPSSKGLVELFIQP